MVSISQKSQIIISLIYKFIDFFIIFYFFKCQKTASLYIHCKWETV